MKGATKGWMGVVFSAILLAGAAIGAEGLQEGAYTVYVDEGLVTLEANNAALDEVISDVAKKLGIEARFIGEVSATVTGTVRGATFPELVREIARNWVLEETVSGRGDAKVSRVFLLPKGTEGSIELRGTGARDGATEGKAGARGGVSTPSGYARRVVPQDAEGHRELVSNELLVRFLPTVKQDQIDALNRKQGATVLKVLPLVGAYRLRFPENVDLEAVGREYAGSGLASNVERNYVVRALGVVPNDPDFPKQWGLEKIRAPEAWGVTTGSPEVVVAVIDTGLDTSHPDLAGKAATGYDVFTGVEGVPADDNGHGTQVAGIISANANDGSGIAGVAWHATLMPIKALDATGVGTYADLIEAIAYAVDHGADVINMSFGGYGRSEMLEAALRYAHDRNTVLVAAGGNESTSDPCYPAAFPNVLGVAATGPDNGRWVSSNYGATIDLAAPGVGIYTTHLGGGHGSSTGSSSAAAFVSGAAALMKAMAPSSTNTQIEQTLKATAVDLGDEGQDPYYGAGLLDVFASVSTPVPMSHDLSVVRLTIDPATFGPNVTPDIAVSIRNEGNFDESNVVVTVFIDETQLGAPVTLDLIPAGDMREVRVPLPLDATGPDGVFTVTCVVRGMEGESDLGDNRWTSSFRKKDEEDGTARIMHKSEPWAMPHQFYAGEAARVWPGWSGKEFKATVTVKRVGIWKQKDWMGDDEIYFKIYVNDKYVELPDSEGYYNLSNSKKSEDLDYSITTELRPFDILQVCFVGIHDNDFSDRQQKDAEDDTDDFLHGRFCKVYEGPDWGSGLHENVQAASPRDSEYGITVTFSISVTETGEGTSLTPDPAEEEIWRHIGTLLVYDTYELDESGFDDRFFVATYSGGNGNRVHNWGNGGHKDKYFSVPYYGTVPFSNYDYYQYNEDIQSDTINDDVECGSWDKGCMSVAGGNNIIEGAHEEDVYNPDFIHAQFQYGGYYYRKGIGPLDRARAAKIFRNHFFDPDQYGIPDACGKGARGDNPFLQEIVGVGGYQDAFDGTKDLNLMRLYNHIGRVADSVNSVIASIDNVVEYLGEQCNESVDRWIEYTNAWVVWLNNIKGALDGVDSTISIIKTSGAFDPGWSEAFDVLKFSIKATRESISTLNAVLDLFNSGLERIPCHEVSVTLSNACEKMEDSVKEMENALLELVEMSSNSATCSISAYEKAQLYWENYVIPEYVKGNEGNKDNAYYFLGRITHLLEDMSSSPHVLRDAHGPYWGTGGNDAYEDGVGTDYVFAPEYADEPIGDESRCAEGVCMRWRPEEGMEPVDYEWPDRDVKGGDTGRSVYGEWVSPRAVTYGPLENEIPRSFPGGSEWTEKVAKTEWRSRPPLFRLFYSMAEITDNFPSSDTKDDFGRAYGYDGTNWKDYADEIMPAMVQHVASLYKLFWDTTHSINSIVVGGRNVRDSESITIEASDNVGIEAEALMGVGVEMMELEIATEAGVIEHHHAEIFTQNEIRDINWPWETDGRNGKYRVVIRAFVRKAFPDLEACGSPESTEPGCYLLVDQDTVEVEVVPADSDGDGMPDEWELANGLDPKSGDDAAADPDGDGWTNLKEFQEGTDPQGGDSDGDGLKDGVDRYPLYAMRVNTMPNGVGTPKEKWESPMYVWPGLDVDLWGAVRGGAGPYTYEWTCSDTGEPVRGTVGDPRNISVHHTFEAGTWVCTLTVTDANGYSESSSVHLDVGPKTFQMEVNLAVQKSLKYLYLQSKTTTEERAYWDGSYGSTNYRSGFTPLALLAFEDHGHQPGNDPAEDIYQPLAEMALRYVFGTMARTGLSGITDTNGNGQGLFVPGAAGRDCYCTGIAMMALAATESPAEVADYGTYTQGKTYREILTDLVDWTAWAQNSDGGWRYSANYGSSDNSATQWPVLGLAAAGRAPWNIEAPSFVKQSLLSWLGRSQYPDSGWAYGAFSYGSKFGRMNTGLTGSGIISLCYCGVSAEDSRVQRAVDFLNRNWGAASTYNGNLGDHYAMYAVKKGLQFAGIKAVGSHDWQQEYNEWYVSHQNDSGYWPGWWTIYAGVPSAIFGSLVMAPGLVELPPVAEAGIVQEVNPLVSISFDGRASYHADPDKSIVSFLWDFDASDGLDWANPDAAGDYVTLFGGYLDLGHDYEVTVTLRVEDEDGRVDTDTTTVRVLTGNVPPVADAGGPYLVAVGEDVVLDGSGSYDPNEGDPVLQDEIVEWLWDLDGDGQFDDASGEVVTWNYGPNFVGTKTVRLKVTDRYGVSKEASSETTTVAVSNLHPVRYELVGRPFYNRRTRTYTVTWRMVMENVGDGDAFDVSAEMSNVPFGVSVNDGDMAWSGTIEAGSSVTSDDTFSYTYRRGANIDLTAITWDIQFTDGLGTRHVVRAVPQ